MPVIISFGKINLEEDVILMFVNVIEVLTGLVDKLVPLLLALTVQNMEIINVWTVKKDLL